MMIGFVCMRPGVKKDGRLAFTVLELMVVVFIIAVLAALILPAITRRYQKSSKINCVNNMKQVGLAFRMWAGDKGDRHPMQYRDNFDGPSYANSKQMYLYFQVISNELNTPKVLICPEDNTRSAATNFTSDFDSRRTSYFVGLDSDEALPNSILSGDSNLENGLVPKDGVLELGTNQTFSWSKGRHENSGNIAFGDGSVQRLTGKRLKMALGVTGVATNRIVLPEEAK